VARLPRFAQETPNARVGVAIAGGCEERWVELRPYEGAILTTLKVARRIVAVGGTPLGLTDCLNFGSPTNPAVMRQLSDAIDGITAVSKALSLPVVSGNVSLNNQTEGRPIPPTPMLGVVGRVDDVAKVRLTRLPEPAWEACSRYVVLRVNHPELARRATLECGLAWWLLAGRNSDIPTPDLKAERDLWTALERIATEVNAPLCAPVGQGGALVGAFRMAFLNEATLALSPEVLTRPARDVFAEGQAGFLLGVPSYAAAALSEAALGAGLDVFPIGEMLRPAPTDAASSAHDNGSSNLPLRLRAAWRDGLVPFYAHV
jgi:phosphoribosylformylglycinamidine (FGAM) synthase-like enzyme